MKIFFTKKQYETLVKLAYLGDWLANAHKAGDGVNAEFEKLEDYIYSFAGDFGIDELFKQGEDGITDPTREFEEMLDPYIDEYNDDNFWETLVNRLARRDFIEHYGQDTVSSMDLAELFEKEEPFLKKYDDEFYANGLKNLYIRNDLFGA